MLRGIGLGGQVDEFVESMNHAAEEAATRYFEARTREDLRAAFTPVVREALQRVGVTRLYRQVSEPYICGDYDLDAYGIGKALDGLFYTLALEEKRIREDPAARVTELLRRVFGNPEG